MSSKEKVAFALATGLQDKKRNLMRYTEDLSNAIFSTTNATKDATNVLNYKGINLAKLNGANFYSALRSNLNGTGLAAFQVGKRYLLSAYVISLSDKELFFWMRDVISNKGHGAKLADGKVRRIWCLTEAITQFHIDALSDANIELGLGAQADPKWFVFNTMTGSFDVRIGGFQIEEVPDTYKDGVAVIGDSTMAGSSGKIDNPTSREVSRYAEAILNVPFFNRAVGGETTNTMDGRWATDITPLAVNCKYVIIQGGINDISQGRTLVDIQASITSMNAKAKANGLIPIHATITPNSANDAAKKQLMLDLNAWIKQTFPNVLDFHRIIANPADPHAIRNQTDAEWYGDGVHYGIKAKRALGTAIAKWSGWDFIAPSPYQPVITVNPRMRPIEELFKPAKWELPFPQLLDVRDVDTLDLSARS